MKTIYYSSPDHDTPRYSLEIMDTYNIHRPIEAAEIAELCAYDLFFKNCEAEYYDINLYETETSEVVDTYVVAVVPEPVFYAKRKRIKKPRN